MSVINVIFTDGQVTAVDSSGSFEVGYFTQGQLFTDISLGPGYYSVKDDPLSPTFSTEIYTQNFEPLVHSNEFLVFQGPALGGPLSHVAATPEASTWLMLAIGFVALAHMARRRISARAA